MTGFPSPDYQVVMGGEEMKDRLPMSKAGFQLFCPGLRLMMTAFV